MKLLALSWAMPPLVFPRAIQVARLLAALRAHAWTTDVVAVHRYAVAQATLDNAFAAHYHADYALHAVEPRESAAPSALWLRAMRRLQPPADLDADNWLRRALARLHRLANRVRPDAFATFAQPWSDHVVGLRLKEQLPNLPWLAHFSDPWVDSPYRQGIAPDADVADRAHERAVVERADALVFVNAATAALVMDKYPQRYAAKVHIVSHGFDATLRATLPAAAPRGVRMRVVYAGNLFAGREPSALLEALAALRAKSIDDLPLDMIFVGVVPDAARERIAALGLAQHVTCVGTVGYLASLAHAQDADLLLVMDAPFERNVFLPSKVVDYLMLERPVLALTPGQGPTAEVLGALGFPCVAPHDVDAIEHALADALARWRTGLPCTPLPPTVALAPYDIAHAAQGFASALAAAMRTAGTPA